MYSKASEVARELRRHTNAERARVSMYFFKTGKGEYGEGDKFLGTSVPNTRKICKLARGMSEAETLKLLRSHWHEERMAGVLLMVDRFERSKTDAERAKAVAFYIKNLKYVNNWDLVDSSAYRIIGAHLLESKNRKQLYKWAKSKNIWERRVAIIATLAFIRDHQFDDTIKLAKIYLKDDQDLMYKATGWMLRELGKRDVKVLEAFLDQHAHVMPRTMLRYALEKFSARKRSKYMQLR